MSLQYCTCCILHNEYKHETSTNTVSSWSRTCRHIGGPADMSRRKMTWLIHTRNGFLCQALQWPLSVESQGHTLFPVWKFNLVNSQPCFYLLSWWETEISPHPDHTVTPHGNNNGNQSKHQHLFHASSVPGTLSHSFFTRILCNSLPLCIDKEKNPGSEKPSSLSKTITLVNDRSWV